MIKKIFVITLLSFYTFVWAQEQSCEIIPKKPVVGEKFQLVCRIQVINDTTPDIIFDKMGVEVISRRKIDASIRSTVRNGQIFTFKEAKYVFDLSSDKGGRKKIYNLKIISGEKVVKHRDISFQVRQTRPRSQDLFAMAITEKDQAYVGEGVDVNYYLYYRVQRKSHIIEEWPKVKDFFKREINLIGNDVAETVSYEGEMYYRLLLYSHRLYPEREGSFAVGRIKVTVEYMGLKRYGLLGNFGSSRKKTVISPNKKIEVLALPIKMMPKSFTGLVGKHEFSVTVSREKYLVNEPIELKLTIVGTGNLEQFVPPSLLIDKNLEEFDQNSEILKEDKGVYKKVVDYTYLARAPLEIKSSKQLFSYFNEKTKKFVEVDLTIPAVKVLGMANISHVRNTEKKIEQPSRKLMAPIFMRVKIAEYGMLYLNGLLAFLILIIGLSLVDWKDKMPGVDEYLAKACRDVKDSAGDYSAVFSLISFLQKENMPSTAPLKNVVMASQLSEQAKEYFSDLIDWSERRTFASEHEKENFKFRKKHFKEFVAYVTRRLVDEGNY